MSVVRPDNMNLAAALVAIVNPKDPMGDRQLFDIASGMGPAVVAGKAPAPDPEALRWLIERCNELLKKKP